MLCYAVPPCLCFRSCFCSCFCHCRCDCDCNCGCQCHCSCKSMQSCAMFILACIRIHELVLRHNSCYMNRFSLEHIDLRCYRQQGIRQPATSLRLKRYPPLLSPFSQGSGLAMRAHGVSDEASEFRITVKFWTNRAFDFPLCFEVQTPQQSFLQEFRVASLETR